MKGRPSLALLLVFYLFHMTSGYSPADAYFEWGPYEYLTNAYIGDVVSLTMAMMKSQGIIYADVAPSYGFRAERELSCLSSKQHTCMALSLQSCVSLSQPQREREIFNHIECMFHYLIEFDKQNGIANQTSLNTFVNETRLSDEQKAAANNLLNACLSKEGSMTSLPNELASWFMTTSGSITESFLKILSNWMNGLESCDIDKEGFANVKRQLIIFKSAACLIDSLLRQNCSGVPNLDLHDSLFRRTYIIDTIFNNLAGMAQIQWGNNGTRS